MTFSLINWAQGSGGAYTNRAYIYVDGTQYPETTLYNYINPESAFAYTGGRSVYLSLNKGQTVTLQTTRMEFKFVDILVCFEFKGFLKE